jgi:hypothetical protein
MTVNNAELLGNPGLPVCAMKYGWRMQLTESHASVGIRFLLLCDRA